jgi:type III secretory pathway component EscS
MKLIENWASNAWRMWSVRLAAFAGIVAGILTANPALVLGLINFMPNGFGRYVASAVVGLVVFVIPTITRLANQEKLRAED